MEVEEQPEEIVFGKECHRNEKEKRKDGDY